jgi:hypothetical protein
MKFDTTKTKGGYKILSIHGPSSCGSYYGTVQDDTGAFFTCTWESDGRDNDYPNARGFDLIPLAEEPEPSDTTELWNYVHSSSKEINALRELVEGALKRMDNMQADYIARVNGLRADYLADQSAVQPSRVDALEERLEALEQRTQTDEKGVWVTRESLKRAFDATQEFIMRNDRFKEIAERLGLEE